MGHEELVVTLKDATRMSLIHPNRMLFLKETVDSHLHFKAEWIDPYSMNVITDHITCGVVQLRSECGNVDHAVGISGM